MKALVLTSLAVASLVVACSSSSSTNPGIVGSNGVNDVSKACAIRAGWTKADTTTCAQCAAYAGSPRCPCSDIDVIGACSDQQTALTNEPGCTEAHACAGKCKNGDCTCVDACYVGKDACHSKASALDGCLAEVCGSSCQ
jgi:hypothetical protein